MEQQRFYLTPPSVEQCLVDGLLKRQSMNLDDERKLSLYCYTQDCFFNGGWNETTLTHRGRLYLEDENGVRVVNNPFPKIFNLNEVPGTSWSVVKEKMKSEPYSVYDKANGHLFIVSTFWLDDEPQFVFHTKGSLTTTPNNELLNKSVEKFERMYPMFRRMVIDVGLVGCTFMFEAIVEHDKHTMYEEQLSTYASNDSDKDIFVLLGIRDERGDLTRSLLELISMDPDIGCPIVRRYNSDELNGPPMDWFEDKNVEGYVIHFHDDGLRVKVKTKEYWALRFKKDLTLGRILQIYRAGGVDRMRKMLPEEVVEKIIPLIIELHRLWFIEIGVFGGQIPVANQTWWEWSGTAFDCELTADQKKKISQSYLADKQKTYLFEVNKNNVNFEFLQNSKKMRDELYACYLDDRKNGHWIFDVATDEIQRIVDTIGQDTAQDGQ